MCFVMELPEQNGTLFIQIVQQQMDGYSFKDGLALRHTYNIIDKSAYD